MKMKERIGGRAMRARRRRRLAKTKATNAKYLVDCEWLALLRQRKVSSLRIVAQFVPPLGDPPAYIDVPASPTVYEAPSVHEANTMALFDPPPVLVSSPPPSLFRQLWIWVISLASRIHG